MEEEMTHKSRILCDNCLNYAKATLEGRNLCAGCLLGELMSSKDAETFEHLTPLEPEQSTTQSLN